MAEGTPLERVQVVNSGARGQIPPSPFEMFKHFKRRRRDLTPRAAINDLHPFQGCPFSHLGYFSMC